MIATREDIAEIAKRYLEPYQPDTYRLNIKESSIKQDEDFWYVIVHPSREDVRSFDYYGRLAEAEEDIESHEHIKILLMPVIPG